ncbi:pantoate--beta-alanine ligase [bacterium]|nr:pantoate--beta-alanine ligase [bacterium]
METVLYHTISEVKEKVREWKRAGLTIGLVPTMGALHIGHASLMKAAREKCDRVVASVFVNPIQFGPNEDFDKYPRTLEADVKLAGECGVDVVFAPSPKEMYGEGIKLSNDLLTYVCPPFDYVDKLCGKSRPGHFDGVCTVVNKLFNIASPDFAFFGEKDAQQLIIIKKMVKDLNMNLEIVPCPIVREEDGLAVSSRNTYLSAEARKKAPTVYKALCEVRNLISKGVDNREILLDSALNVLDKDIELEYLEFVNISDLSISSKVTLKNLIVIAVKLDGVRLIDNIFPKG